AAALADRMSEALLAAGPATHRAPAARVPVLDRESSLVPLSLGQKRLWFLDQFVADSAEYFVPMAMRLRGRLAVAALTAALRELIAGRGVVRPGGGVGADAPVGLVRPAERFSLDRLDGDPAKLSTKDQLAEFAATEGFRAFDLEHGLPIRAGLLPLGRNDHLLCVTVHHIVFDGWSSSIFFDELELLYDAFAHGRPPPLPPLALH